MQGGSSSSGSGEGGKLELPWKAYAKVEAKHSINGCGQCIPVMVSVSGIREKTKRGKQRAPMDVVVVLHVRRGKDNFNAPKNWRWLLKQAMYTVAASLREKDRLAVVPGASTLMPAWRFITPQIIENLSPAMITSLVGALEYAESILLGREHKEKMRRPGHIIVISNSDDDMGSLVPYRNRYVRHAFGFRDAHNARTMQSLCSSIRNCTYSVLDDEQGQIAPAFFASIDRTITSAVAAVPTEVKLKCEQKVLVAAIDTPGVRHFISYDKKVGLVWPPAHLTAEPFKFLVYLGNLPLRCSEDDLHRLVSIQAKYKYRGGGSDDVSSSPPVHKFAVQEVTRKKNVRESKEVAAEMVRTKVVKMVADILAQDKMDWEQLHGTAESLRLQWKRFKETDYCYIREAAAGDDDGVVSGLSADIYEMEMRLHNNYFWQEYMLSWHTHQRWQQPIPRPFMDKQPTRNQDLLVVDVFEPSPADEDKFVFDNENPAARGQEGHLPVLVRVMASEVGLAMEKRASVDLVVIVDAAYGAKEMEETLEKRRKLLSEDLEEQLTYAKQIKEEIERVKYRTKKRLDVITKAIEFVQKKLSAKDRLAIICAQFPDTEPVAGLLEMSTRGQWQTTAKLEKLMGKLVVSEARRKIPVSRASLRHEAMKLMRACLNGTLNSSTPILTSAEYQDTTSMTVNSGDAGGSTMLSKALIHAVKMLGERREQEDHRMGFIIVLSDRDDDSIFGETLSRKYITHAFGLHEKHNMWAMYHIARSCNGIYDILNDESYKLTEAFMACINKITSTIAVDTKIDIKCRHSSVVSSAIESSSGLFGSYWISIKNSGKYCSINAGALSAGTVANFIINMDQVREDELFTIHVEWEDPLGNTKEKPEDKVVDRKGGADLGRSNGEGVIAKRSIDHVKAIEIVNKIAGPLYQDRMMVEAYLKEKCVACSEIAESAGEDRLARAMTNMADNLKMETKNPSYFKQLVAQTLSCMLSWLSYHRSSQQAL